MSPFPERGGGSACPAVSQLLMYSSSSHAKILLTVVEVEGLNIGCTRMADVLDSLLFHMSGFTEGKKAVSLPHKGSLHQ